MTPQHWMGWSQSPRCPWTEGGIEPSLSGNKTKQVYQSDTRGSESKKPKSPSQVESGRTFWEQEDETSGRDLAELKPTLNI